MEFAEKFLPTAGLVGILPMITWFSMLVACYAFVGNVIFALMSRSSVAPEHRISRDYTAIIAAVAGISYFLIQSYYKDMLHELATIDNEEGRTQLLRTSYNAIGQLRYMDWAITTPLLLLKMTAMLKVQYRKYRGMINTLLLADLFMIVTGYIGEQQLTPDNEILVAPKLVWGAISTVGYVIVVYVLYKIWRDCSNELHVKAPERWAYKVMGIMVVTFWGVYPIGYILTAVTSIDTNWIHLSFSIADVINKVGVGAIAYQAADAVLEERLPMDSVAPYRSVS